MQLHRLIQTNEKSLKNFKKVYKKLTGLYVIIHILFVAYLSESMRSWIHPYHCMEIGEIFQNDLVTQEKGH